MIPYGDTVKTKRPPWVNISLIVINVAIFIYIMYVEKAPRFFINKYGFIPKEFFYAGWTAPLQNLMNILFNLFTLISAQFLHADILHIVGNMLFLFVFGDNIEDRIGHFRYIVFYLLCGAIAMLVHGYVFKGSTLVVIGASGAIAGVMGAFYILYPAAKIKTFLIVTLKEFDAIYYIGVWFLFNLVRGVLYMEGLYAAEPVAWWAHVGGFIGGALLINLFALNPPKK